MLESKVSRSIILLCATACIATSGARAQSTAGSGVSPSSGVALEEVTVTAQRREEKLDKVPISISAYTGAQLQHAGISDMAAIARQTPGFAAVPGATIGGGSNISIRGISTVQGAATIGIYLDD